MKAARLFLILSLFALYSCEKAPPTVAREAPGEETSEPLADVTPAEAAELLKGNAVTVLDVRTPEEYAEGHIAGAINIDFKNPAFGENIEGLKKDEVYLLHCRSGGRSAEALKQLETLGLEKIYHLTSGMNGWQDAGLQVEK